MVAGNDVDRPLESIEAATYELVLIGSPVVRNVTRQDTKIDVRH